MVYQIYRGRRKTYYKYGSYNTINEARRVARYWRRKNGSRYKISEEWKGDKKNYCVYLTKVIKG